MDKLRKKQYNDYFNRRNGIQEVYDKHLNRVELDKCTCITHAQEKSCNKKCDSETLNKPFIL